MNEQPGGGGDQAAEPTSTGLDRNLGGLLTYLFGPITGIIFLIVEKKSPFIRFHAMQSTVTFGALLIINVIATALPMIGLLISMLVAPIALILWIVLMYKAFQGERFKLPVLGDWAEQLLPKLDGSA